MGRERTDELLLEVLARRREQTSGTPIALVPRSGELPLSFCEERLWFLNEFTLGDATQNIVANIRLRGALDEAALQTAVDQLILRHESLRTRFAGVHGVPRRVIEPAATVAIRHIDLGEASDREERLRAIFAAEAERPVDLVDVIPLRVGLVRLSALEHELIITVHHIVADGVSVGIMFSNLGKLYSAAHKGVEPDLRRLPVQYADYAAWHRKTLEASGLDDRVALWKERLAGNQVLRLPTDRARSGLRPVASSTVVVTFESDLVDAIRAFAWRKLATTSMAVLTGFVALLSRYSGQNDFAVGTVAANRDRPEIEDAVGCFVDLMPVKVHVDGNARGSDLLAGIRKEVLFSYANVVPLQRLVQAVNPARHANVSPIFQVEFIADSWTTRPTFSFDQLTAEVSHNSANSTAFDLALYCSEQADNTIRCEFLYGADLFDLATIERIASSFETILAAMVAQPDEIVDRLPMISEKERQRCVVTCNDTAKSLPDETIQGLFEAQALRTPDAIAVAFDGKHLTYRELDQRANRWARRLARCGVGPESYVAVCLERSLDLVVALVAILKAGAAYVPFDPSYPAERLRYMLEEVSPTVLLTVGELAAWFRDGAKLVVDMHDGEATRELDTRLAPPLAPANLAYGIFTSGSTGRPKLVMNTHRGILNRILWMQNAYGLEASDAVLQKTPLSFDVSVWEFFWPLAFGARLVMAEPDGHRDPAYLHRVIREAGVTTIHFVPPMLAAFLDDDSPISPSLRRVICSGEALPLELTRRFLARSTAELHNLYGPTEAAVDVTAWACSAQDSIVPIGRAIDNTALYVVDRWLETVPTGVVGEICIGGIQLARGYGNRADLTAERFVPDPFGAPGGRLYRTGDLGYRLPDGAIAYVGRTDDQVKIRGNRIELGEIETVLAAQTGVVASTVLARGDGGSKRLVAYVVGTVEEGRLREALRARLPDFMIPAAFVRLDAMPVTSNGKIDRRSLPDAVVAVRGPVAPRNETERVLVKIWQEVIQLEEVGVEDDFFDIGGDSLLAMRIVARVQSQFTSLIRVRDVFLSPTIATFAALLAAQELEELAANAQ